MSPPPPSGLLLARLDELPDPCAQAVSFEHEGARFSLIVARHGGRVTVFRNRCPHAGYPLQRADGRILVQEGRYMVCGAHGASFRLQDGACAGGPCNGERLERIAIAIRENAVFSA
ncbi:MAG: Rieske 2Fe-2S domain-containing protein [Hyphomonadaceae bacterium]